MRWQPAHEAHAIERVSVTFQFAEAVSSKPWQPLLNAASLDLPKRGFNATIDEHEIAIPQLLGVPGLQNQAAGFPFALAPGGILGPAQAAQIAVIGRNFQALNGGQIREEVQIHRNRFTHSAMLYEGWVSYRTRALSLLRIYLDMVLPLVDLQSIKMEYWDRFVFKGEIQNVDYGELLRRESKHVPKFPFGIDQLWHSHVGYFVPLLQPSRRLVNVNIDVVDVGEQSGSDQALQQIIQRRSVGIYSMAQDSFSPGGSPSASDGTISTLEVLHTSLKEIFADVITTEAADRISLNAQVPL